MTELADTSARVSHIGLGPDGEPMVVDYGGTLYQMVPRPPKGCP